MRVKIDLLPTLGVIFLCLVPGIIYYIFADKNNYTLVYFSFFCIAILGRIFFGLWPFLIFDVNESGIQISLFGKKLYLLTWDKVRTVGTISTREGLYVYVSTLTAGELMRLNTYLISTCKGDEYTYIGSILDKKYMMNRVIWRKDRLALIQDKPLLRLDSVLHSDRDKQIISTIKHYSAQFAAQTGGQVVSVYHFGSEHKPNVS